MQKYATYLNLLCVFFYFNFFNFFLIFCVFVCNPVLQGFYMYIETSRPRKEGDQARLVSPFFNIAPKNPYSISNSPAYCFGFFYHMYGKHIGELHLLFFPQSSSSAAKII